MWTHLRHDITPNAPKAVFGRSSRAWMRALVGDKVLYHCQLRCLRSARVTICAGDQFNHETIVGKTRQSPTPPLSLSLLLPHRFSLLVPVEVFFTIKGDPVDSFVSCFSRRIPSVEAKHFQTSIRASKQSSTVSRDHLARELSDRNQRGYYSRQ